MTLRFPHQLHPFRHLFTLIILSSNVLASEYKLGDKVGNYIIGETISYSIHWGLMKVGFGSFATDLHEDPNAGTLIRLRFSSQSYGMANKLYPVDDCIDTYLSPKTLRPLYVIKKTREGDIVCDTTLVFDDVKNMGHWEDRHNNKKLSYPITSNTRDFYTLLHELRKQKLSSTEEKEVQVAVDDKTHQIAIQQGREKTIKLAGLGKTLCKEVKVTPLTEGLFVHKFPSDIWVTQNKPHVLASMKIKVAVGKVKIKFKKHEIRTEATQVVSKNNPGDQG